MRGPRINGQAICAIRVASGLSQVALARAAGLDSSYISRIESGRRRYPAPAVTRRIAEALRVPVTAILADTEAAS